MFCSRLILSLVSPSHRRKRRLTLLPWSRVPRAVAFPQFTFHTCHRPRSSIPPLIPSAHYTIYRFRTHLYSALDPSLARMCAPRHVLYIRRLPCARSLRCVAVPSRWRGHGSFGSSWCAHVRFAHASLSRRRCGLRRPYEYRRLARRPSTWYYEHVPRHQLSQCFHVASTIPR